MSAPCLRQPCLRNHAKIKVRPILQPPLQLLQLLIGFICGDLNEIDPWNCPPGSCGNPFPTSRAFEGVALSSNAAFPPTLQSHLPLPLRQAGKKQGAENKQTRNPFYSPLTAAVPYSPRYYAALRAVYSGLFIGPQLEEQSQRR